MAKSGIEMGNEMADAFDKMIFSIVNDKVGDNFIVEGETTKECQSQAFDGLIKRDWDMGDCHSVPLNK